MKVSRTHVGHHASAHAGLHKKHAKVEGKPKKHHAKHHRPHQVRVFDVPDEQMPEPPVVPVDRRREWT